MIRSVLFFETLLSLAFPQVTRAQYSTRTLKYNGKGEVTGVIEGKPSDRPRKGKRPSRKHRKPAGRAPTMSLPPNPARS